MPVGGSLCDPSGGRTEHGLLHVDGSRLQRLGLAPRPSTASVAPPLVCAALSECLVHDDAGLLADPDPTDDAGGTAIVIQHQNPLNLQGVFCVDAITCMAWGSDSGTATRGLEMTTQVWRGPSSGGAWSRAALPAPPGHDQEVPLARTLACVGSTCTAIGEVRDARTNYLTLTSVVWTAGADGVWHVVAAGIDDSGGGGSGVTRVPTDVSRIAVLRKANGVRLVGQLTAKQHCARGRVVKVIDRHGRAATRLKSDRHGRFGLRLTKTLLARIGAKVWVKVPNTGAAPRSIAWRPDRAAQDGLLARGVLTDALTRERSLRGPPRTRPSAGPRLP